MDSAAGTVETVDGWSVLKLPHLWVAWGRFTVSIQCQTGYAGGIYCHLNKTIKALPTGFTGSDTYVHAEGYNFGHIYHTAKVGADVRVDALLNGRDESPRTTTFRCVALRVVP